MYILTQFGVIDEECTTVRLFEKLTQTKKITYDSNVIKELNGIKNYENTYFTFDKKVVDILDNSGVAYYDVCIPAAIKYILDNEVIVIFDISLSGDFRQFWVVNFLRLSYSDAQNFFRQMIIDTFLSENI